MAYQVTVIKDFDCDVCHKKYSTTNDTRMVPNGWESVLLPEIEALDGLEYKLLLCDECVDRLAGTLVNFGWRRKVKS